MVQTWQRVAQGKFLVGVGHGCDNAIPPNCYSFCPEDGDEEGNLKGRYEELMTEDNLVKHTHYPKSPSTCSDDIHPSWQWLMTPTFGDCAPIVKQFKFDKTGRTGKIWGFKSEAKGVVYSGVMSEAGQDVANIEPFNNIPPNFGVYIWKRTA